MTLYWWMHWFWITYLAIISVFVTHSMPLSAVPSNLDLEQSRSLTRPINFINKTIISKPQIMVTVPFSNSNGTIDLNYNDLIKSKNSDPNLCSNNRTGMMNSTELKNETRLCNKSSHILSDNLQLSTTVNKYVDSVELKLNISTDDNNFTNEITNNNATVIVSKERISGQLADNDDGISSNKTWNVISITGVSFGVAICVVFIAIMSFILYRRRYLNKPQTLNDKCSNPDSSGYIDDSTIRENSEEMYSLDNDSFLNSLEAMTIQNYWTDSVKHTKL